MALAALIIGIAAIAVSGYQAYWTRRLRKAQRELAEVRAEREATPQPIIKYDGMLTQKAMQALSDRIRASAQRSRS
jgi:hypothetical protein